MKVVITKFPHNSLFGGGEVHTLTLVEKLTPLGFDFTLLSSDQVLLLEFKKKHFKTKKLWAPLEPVSVKGVLLFPFFAPFFFWYLFHYFKKAKKEGVKTLLFLSYTEKILMTPLAYLMGFKIFWMEHLRIEKSYKKNPFKVFYLWFSRYSTVITVSKEVGKQLENLGVLKKNIAVIYIGINTEKFKKSQAGVLKETVSVGVAARLCEEKAIDDLIWAFNKARREVSGLKLIIAGEGPLRESLEKLVGELKIKDKVEFIGFQENVKEFLEKIDIFALTSRAKESFGIAAAEAQSMGLPVVATRISGLSEVVKDLETGFIVDIGNIEAIAEAIIKLSRDRDLRIRLGEAGRRRVIENFSEERMIDAFKKLFKNNGSGVLRSAKKNQTVSKRREPLR